VTSKVWQHRFVIMIAFLSLGLFGTVAYLLYYIFFGQVSLHDLDKTINAADAASASGRLSEAESLYKRAVSQAQATENSAEAADVMSKLATVYEREQKLTEAEAALRRAAQLYEERTNLTGLTGFSSTARKHMLVLAALANILRDHYNYRQAAVLYKQALKESDQDPDNSDKSRISLEYARLLRATGQTADADKVEAQVEAENNEATAFQIGKTQFQQGSYVKAEAFFRAFLANSETRHDGDNSARACIMIAICQLFQSNFDEATQLVRRAQILGSKSMDDQIGASIQSSADTILAYINEYRDKHKDAEDSIAEALKLSPQDAGQTLLDIWAVATGSKDENKMAAARQLCLRAAPHLKGTIAGQINALMLK
jgi:tetratricopeptide (TPR) repeat protein